MQIQIPGYGIVSTLSRSASATIYLAWDSKAERELALKVMALAEDSNLSEHLEQERARWLALTHPNIVKIYDVGVLEKYYFLTMQYLPGYSLNHKRFEMDLLTRLRVVADIAHALDFAGEQGFVHAALTPDNIWVTDHDNDAIILGLGLTQSSTGDAVRASVAGINESDALSAAHFSSPEQLQGKSLDSRSDLYSLGVILYLLLTDDLPFQASSRAELNALDRTTVPLMPECLNAFQPIINRLLAHLPEDRYQHARECIADLGALPESAIVDAIEGAEHLLVREDETPLELMSRVIPFTAYNVFSSRLAEQTALVDSNNTIIVPDKTHRSSAHIERDIGQRTAESSWQFFFDHRKKLILAAVIGVSIALLYVLLNNLFPSAPTDNNPSAEQNQPLSIAASTLSSSAMSIQKVQFATEPNLQQQADNLRARLQTDFAVATDLVIVYRAALRGESSEEHLFAQTGLEELQRLFSERILMYLNEKNMDGAARERQLAEQLFERDEFLPELTDAFSVYEQNVLVE